MTILALNRSTTDEMQLDVELRGLGEGRKVAIASELHHSDIKAINSKASPNAVAPKERTDVSINKRRGQRQAEAAVLERHRHHTGITEDTPMLLRSCIAGNAGHGEPGREAATPTVKTFGLGDVELLDSPFKQAMERNAEYLLSLDADRLLHNTRKYAGLKPKGELYGGWESQGIAGHTLGHYLTALSQQYASTHDPRFKQRLDYIISEMAEAQRAYGDGYIGALPELELSTMRGFKQGKVEVKDAFTFKDGAWVPWYTQHKVLAGLRTRGRSAKVRKPRM